MSLRFGNLQSPFGQALLAILVPAFSLVCPVRPAVAQTQLCVPQVTGLPVESSPGVFSNPLNAPLIPGVTCGIAGSLACPTSPEADTGWFNAYRYSIETTGTEVANQPTYGAIQTIEKDNMLYFSFEINNEAGIYNSNNDTIILAFANFPPSAPPPPNPLYTWIVLSGPFFSSSPGVAQPVTPNNIVAYQGSSTSMNQLADSQPIVAPPWVQAGMSSTQSNPYKWYLVVSMANSASTTALPTTGQFGIFVDAIAAAQAQGSVPTDEQGTLFGVPAISFTNPYSANFTGASLNYPFSSATLAPSAACSGVFIGPADIQNLVTTNTVTNMPEDNIVGGGALNKFQVKVHNSGADAPGVRATFRIANFGLPAPDEWQPLGFDACTAAAAAAAAATPPQPTPPYCQQNMPWTMDSVANNPTSALDVPAVSAGPTGSCMDTTANGCTTLPAGTWTLGRSNSAYYASPPDGDNVHQCVRVDLDSPLNPNNTFINNSAFNNFYYSAAASSFKSFPAFVSAKYPLAGTNNQQTFNLKAIRQPMTGTAGTAMLSKARPQSAVSVGRDTNYLSFIVDACRLSGKTLTIPVRDADGRSTKKTLTFQNCDSVGSYGYLIRHDGPVDTWNYNLAASGAGVSLTASPHNPDLYTLVIPQGQTAQVVTTINPSTTNNGGGTLLSAGKLAAFLDLGANFPQGSFSNSYGNGFSLNAGLEYIATSRVSAEGIFGYHYDSGKTGGSGSVYQFSADAKFYLTTTKLRPFLNGGIGGYTFSPGSTYFGGNAGAGALYTLTPRWGVQGSYNFHAVDTPGSTTKFSTIQSGFRYVF